MLDTKNDQALEDYDKICTQMDEKGWLGSGQNETDANSSMKLWLQDNTEFNKSNPKNLHKNLAIEIQPLGEISENGKNGNNWKDENILESGQIMSTFRTDINSQKTGNVVSSIQGIFILTFFIFHGFYLFFLRSH